MEKHLKECSETLNGVLSNTTGNTPVGLNWHSLADHLKVLQEHRIFNSEFAEFPSGGADTAIVVL